MTLLSQLKAIWLTLMLKLGVADMSNIELRGHMRSRICFQYKWIHVYFLMTEASDFC